MKKFTKTSLALATLAVVYAPTLSFAEKPAQKDDIAALKAEAIGIMKGFGKSLKAELIKAKKAGGPLAAIDVCKKQAPALAAIASKNSGWTVARTSLKLRNPANKPDAYEMKVMQEFEKQLAGGKRAKKIAHAEIVEKDGVKTFRFIKAIGANKMCLGCHGAPKGELKDKLATLYPEDKAIGYKSGDIRGVFTLSKVLGTKAKAPMNKGSH